MARHRSEAPSAPRHAPNAPVDPFGDPVDIPGVAAPPSARSVTDTAPPSPPFGLPGPVPEGAPGSYGLRVDPLSGPIGALEPTALEPTALEPTAGAVGAARAWSPAVPEPRAGEGRHAWAVEPDVEPVIPPATRHRATPPPAPAVPYDVTPPARPENGSGPVTRLPRAPERRETSGRPASSGRGAGHDPETNPLDLAAIALAGARTPTGSHRFGPTGGLPGLAARSGPLPAPTTGGHRVVGERGGARGLSPTRTAGALAVAGALVSAGVAVLSSGSMLASAESSRTATEPPAATQQEAGDR